MKGILLSAVYLALGFASFASAQNEIDYVNSLHWSGYGKMAIDGDTLYLNSLNGQGVERYDISNPASPTFIDREHVSGFDQIDFGRRLMSRNNGTHIALADFGDFDSTRVLSYIPIPPQTSSFMPEWKIKGNNLMTVLDDDTIRTYNISDAASPQLTAAVGLYRPPYQYFGYGSVIGTEIYLNTNTGIDGLSNVVFRDVYDIRDPGNIHLVYSDTLPRGPLGIYYLYEANGDTIASISGSIMGGGLFQLTHFTPSDSLAVIVDNYGLWPPPRFESSTNGYISIAIDGVHGYAFSYPGLGEFGGITLPSFSPYSFEFYNGQYLFYNQSSFLKVYQATHSSEPMPVADSLGPAHYGILSVASYGNYVLSGAESNGGELLIHELNQNGDLALAAVLPGIEAQKIIIDSLIALCLCPDKISAVDISNPDNPIVLHEISGFNGPLVDFDQEDPLILEDSLLYAVTDRAYYIVRYDRDTGFILHGTLDLPGEAITSVTHSIHLSHVLKGSTGTVLKIIPNLEGQPYVMQEYHLPHENYVNLEPGPGGLWASGPAGVDIRSFWSLDSAGFYGPEYFADGRQFVFSGDTLYVADGIGGIRVYTSHWTPDDTLRFIGGYGTGNMVNQVARIGDNFFASDYYSLQHLRWGAPTGVGEDDKSALPQELSNFRNYPNPFNVRTSISYELPRESDVALTIYNILGDRVQTVELGRQSAGAHTFVWDADGFGSGIYFYRIVAGHLTAVRKMLLIK